MRQQFEQISLNRKLPSRNENGFTDGQCVKKFIMKAAEITCPEKQKLFKISVISKQTFCNYFNYLYLLFSTVLVM